MQYVPDLTQLAPLPHGLAKITEITFVIFTKKLHSLVIIFMVKYFSAGCKLLHSTCTSHYR